MTKLLRQMVMLSHGYKRGSKRNQLVGKQWLAIKGLLCFGFFWRMIGRE